MGCLGELLKLYLLFMRQFYICGVEIVTSTRRDTDASNLHVLLHWLVCLCLRYRPNLARRVVLSNLSRGIGTMARCLGASNHVVIAVIKKTAIVITNIKIVSLSVLVWLAKVGMCAKEVCSSLYLG
jgi:hypothetical protein